ncbi:MAG: hypothetical protein ABFD92_01280 [Planctomycetaceae bacterium]|nr:hypothetical protein [Planctomycetaceae bacterium]
MCIYQRRRGALSMFFRPGLCLAAFLLAASIPSLAAGQPAVSSQAVSWEEMNQQFLQTSKAMLEQRAKLPPELARLAHKKSIVPLPAASSVENPDHFVTLQALPVAAIVEKLTPEAYRLPTYANVLVPTLKVDPTQAKIELAVKAGASLGPAKGPTALTIEGRRRIFAVAANSAPVFMDEEMSFETAARVKLDTPVSFEFKQTLIENDALGGERQMKIGCKFKVVEAAMGFSSKDGVFIEAGKDLAIKTAAGEYSVGVEARGSVPAELPPSWLIQTLISSGLGRKLGLLIPQDIVCPYCKGLKRAHCPTCNDKLLVPCPKCDGTGGPECFSCKGKGRVPCPKKTTCWSCGGTGRRSCSTCHGSGSVTRWETVQTTRQQLVVDNVGFDSAGQPVYSRHYESRPCTEQVARRESCDSCDGSGRGGTCGNCSGSGKVTCSQCKGTGLKDCIWCQGTGHTMCWSCWRKKKVSCPMCSGKAHTCQGCEGTGKVRRQ